MSTQLYKVIVPEGTPNRIDGYLSSFGEVQQYTRGEAIKKASMFHGKIEKGGMQPNPRVVVYLNGGVVQDVSFNGVEVDVEIRDYDLDGVDTEEHNSDPNCGWVFKTDSDGDEYQEILWECK